MMTSYQRRKQEIAELEAKIRKLHSHLYLLADDNNNSMDKIALKRKYNDMRVFEYFVWAKGNGNGIISQTEQNK